MKSIRLTALLALAALVGLIAAADATAQFGGGMPGGRGRGGGMDRGGGPARERPPMQEQQSLTDLVAFRLALLQEGLKLTREQEQAWVAYEKRTMALAEDIAREQNRLRSAMTMNAMQQINHAVDAARDRLTAWEDVASAARALYDSLTQQQKELVDARFPSIVNALIGGGMPDYSRYGGAGGTQNFGRAPGPEGK